MLQQVITKKRAIITLLVVVVIAIVSIWLNFSLYSFDIRGKEGEESTSLNTIDQANNSSVATIFNISIIPRSADSIEVKTDSKITRKSLENKPWFGVKNETISLREQKEVSKVGKDGVGCDIELNGEYYSYECDNQSNTIVAYATPANGVYENSVTAEEEYSVITRTPYKEGFLSLVQENHSPDIDIIYSGVSISSPIEQRELDELTLQSDRVELFASTRSDGFAILDSADNKVFVFDGVAGDYRTLESEKAEEGITERMSGCDLEKNNVVCFAQKIESESGDETHGPRSNQSVFVTASLASDATNRVEVGRSFDTVCLNNNYITAQSNDLLYSLNRDSLEKNPYLIDTSTSAFTCGDRPAYTKQHAVFEVTGNSTVLVFRESRFLLSSISTDNSHLYFTTFTDSDGPQTLHTYRLLDRAVSNPKERIEKTLPYTSIDLPIFEMEYDDTAIYIKPEISVISDSQTGEMIINEEILRDTKRQIEDRLRRDGVLDSRSAVYYN